MTTAWRARARASFLAAISPFTMWLGRLDWPFVRRRTKRADVLRALAMLQVGDVMLFGRRGAPTNLAIPGSLTHATIYAGNEQLVEAIGTGVQVSDIYDVVLEHDRYVIVRSTESTPEECVAAVAVAKTLVGRPYDPRLRMADDYGADEGDAAIYCGELEVIAFRRVNPRFTFRGRKRLGVWTAEPMDYLTSPQCFRLVLDSLDPAPAIIALAAAAGAPV
jgi:hypothetical protein